jgi:3-methyladenine DNA glycosylase AlkD
MTARNILNDLIQVADPEKARFLQRFFKTGKGQYGEKDRMLGIAVPVVRKIAKRYRHTPLPELHLLMQTPYHEARFCVLAILTERYKKAEEEEKRMIYNFYLEHTDYISNWDLVDTSCPNIVGKYLLDKNRFILYRLAAGNHLWEQRIAIVSTLTFIRHGQFFDTLALVVQLIDHPHDLIHKACGWMLREVGKRDQATLTSFLEQFAPLLPRTALRYAIEHYSKRFAYIL